MPPRPVSEDLAERQRVFRLLVPHFGKVLPASFFQKTDALVPTVTRIHNLIEGIFKPVWSRYALSISSMLKSPYNDEVFFNPDRTWWIRYSSKSGGMQLAANASLVQCMTDGQPVLVLRQVSDKHAAAGARYRFLGLGLIESFDHATSLFRIRGLDSYETSRFLNVALDDDLVETALRLESLEQWTPFVQEDRAIYQVSAQKRDQAFRKIVLSNYGFTCAVTGQRFHSTQHVEAEGAHIIGKDVRGTDDPRNGLALSRSAHWAFDRGIFTISKDYKVVVNPKAKEASAADFPLLSMNGHAIRPPTDEYYLPHPDALEWHRREKFERFKL